jgi:hypothetical protein
VIRIAPGGSFSRDPDLLRGIEAEFGELSIDQEGLFMLAHWGAAAAGGRWPDGFYLTLTAEFGFRHDDYPTRVYRRTDDRWAAVASKGDHFHWFPTDLAPWRDGSVLALRGFDPIYAYPEHRDETTEPLAASVRQAKASIERHRPLIVIRGASKAPDFGRRDLAAIDALPTGEIVAVVVGDAPLALHFDPATNAVTERPLPGRALASAEVLVEGSALAWIYGVAADPDAPYLVRFDGEAWREDPTPECEVAGIGSFSRSADAETWLVCGSPATAPLFAGDDHTLWRRPADGGWEHVEVPSGAIPTEVVARRSDDVWVGGNVLLHTRKPAKVETVPGYTEMWLEAQERAEPVAPFSCSHGTTIIEGAPGGEQSELVATIDQALRGMGEGGSIALIEVPFRGASRLALQNHAVEDKKAAARLARAMGDRLLGSYCLYREPTRELASWPE